MKIDWLAILAAALLLTGCDQPPAPDAGFAGLGGQADDYSQVTPGRVFTFPADHGQHPGFRIEWWYVTATLEDEQGQRFGVQWTLFRSALRPGAHPDAGWNDGTIWLGHAAATSATEHKVAQRYARGGVEQAGVTSGPFSAWIDDWSLVSASDANDDLGRMQLKAGGDDFRYDLTLTSSKPLVLQGEKGYSQKSQAGQASYYYSQPFFEASGSVQINGRPHKVTGHAWLDREWSSQPLTASQTGWDWFSLQLADGARVMLFRVRQTTGEPYVSGTWIEADGRSRPIRADEVKVSPLAQSSVAGRKIPTRWAISLPSRGLKIEVNALNPNAWMGVNIPYWEGPVNLSGSQGGVGYLEMTGY